MSHEHELERALPEELSSADFERWLERTERDPRASEELDFQADLLAAAELAPAQRTPREQRSALAPVLARQWLWAAAASVLFAAVLALWFVSKGERPSPSELAQRQAPRYIASELRAPDGSADESFPRAMALYSSGDHAAAASALEACLALGEHGPARFYLGACREQLGELERARGEYSRVAEAEPGFLADHARWRLANLYLAQSDVARARAELERLRAAGGSFAGNARTLLERLPAP